MNPIESNNAWLLEEVKTNISKIKLLEKSKAYQDKLEGILSSKQNVAKRLAELNQEVLRTQLEETKDEKKATINDYFKDIFPNQKLDKISKGMKITIDFKPEILPRLAENWLIFSLWDLPKEILSIKYDWKIYTRVSNSKSWEFVDSDSNILQVWDKMSIEVLETRDEQNLKKLDEKLNEWLEKKSAIDKTVTLKIRERWMNDDILFDKLKQDLLSDDDGMDDEESLKNRFKWYPKDLTQLNQELDKLIDEYIYEKWVYKIDEKKLQEKLSKLTEEKDSEKRQEIIQEAFQPQIDFATTNYPENWTQKVEKWDLSAEYLEKHPLLKLINELFKWILWVNLFWNIVSLNGEAWPDYNNPEMAREAMWNIIWWAGSFELWSLSEQYESGKKWPYAHNADDNWLPSFGTYQLRWDALGNFVNLYNLKTKEKNKKIEKENEKIVDKKKKKKLFTLLTEDWYREKWRNTKFANSWKQVVSENEPEKFKKLEHEFIKLTHYDKQVSKIRHETWVDIDSLSMSVRNVVWSVSVQHWPNSSLVVDTIRSLWKINFWNLNNQVKLIEKLYANRASKYSSQRSRYKSEKYVALQNLKMVNSRAELPRWISSYPKEFKDWVTTCSRTAYKNLSLTLWVKDTINDTASNVYKHFLNKWEVNTNFPNASNGNIADLFMSSVKYPQYGHRAAAFKSWWEWYVLDPYLPAMNWRYTTEPIPFGDYMKYIKSKWRKFYWAKVYA